MKQKKARLLTPSSKLTPVKLLLLSSPFCKTATSSSMKKGSSTNKKISAHLVPQEEEDKENSFEQRMNLESLQEAQIYGLPIIPFGYNSENIGVHHHKRPKLTIDNAGPKINRRLDFDEFASVKVSPLSATAVAPRAVRALATPARGRRLVPTTQSPSLSDARHCSSCTCNQAISRREMLTRIDFESLSSKTALLTSSGSESGVHDAAQTIWRNNNCHQEDYVKMSAKLV